MCLYVGFELLCSLHFFHLSKFRNQISPPNVQRFANVQHVKHCLYPLIVINPKNGIYTSPSLWNNQHQLIKVREFSKALPTFEPYPIASTNPPIDGMIAIKDFFSSFHPPTEWVYELEEERSGEANLTKHKETILILASTWPTPIDVYHYRTHNAPRSL